MSAPGADTLADRCHSRGIAVGLRFRFDPAPPLISYDGEAPEVRRARRLAHWTTVRLVPASEPAGSVLRRWANRVLCAEGLFD